MADVGRYLSFTPNSVIYLLIIFKWLVKLNKFNQIML